MYEEPADANHDAIDQAYRTKCARHAGNYIEPTGARTRLRARYGCRVADLLSGPKLLRPNDW